MKNFQIFDDGQVLSATGASQRVALVGNSRSTDVMIDNRSGSSSVYVRAGGADVVATTFSMRIPPGAKEPFAIGHATHIAYLADSSATVVVHRGDGQ